MKPPPAGIATHTETGVKVHDSGLMFWPIPKCAHTTMDGWLMTCGFRSMFDVRPEDTADFEHFAVVRDPFDRYVSALAEVWRGGVDLNWPEFIEKVEAHNTTQPDIWVICGDPHFASQSDTLTRAPDPTLFDISELLKIRGWLEDRGIVTQSPLPTRNPTDQTMKEWARARLSPDPVLLYYHDDNERI